MILESPCIDWIEWVLNIPHIMLNDDPGSNDVVENMLKLRWSWRDIEEVGFSRSRFHALLKHGAPIFFSNSSLLAIRVRSGQRTLFGIKER